MESLPGSYDCKIIDFGLAKTFDPTDPSSGITDAWNLRTSGDFFVLGLTILRSFGDFLFFIPDAPRLPPPTPQDFFGG